MSDKTEDHEARATIREVRATLQAHLEECKDRSERMEANHLRLCKQIRDLDKASFHRWWSILLALSGAAGVMFWKITTLNMHGL